MRKRQPRRQPLTPLNFRPSSTPFVISLLCLASLHLQVAIPFQSIISPPLPPSTSPSPSHTPYKSIIMGWFSSTPSPSPAIPAAVNQPFQPQNLASDTKPAARGEGTEKVKPCCVCKDEKSQRDECMLFSRSDDPQDDCKGLVTRYKECMGGYGFKI